MNEPEATFGTETEAVRQMRRGLMAIQLEVHESIADSMRDYFNAVVAEHAAEIAAAEARGRAAGMEEAALTIDAHETAFRQLPGTDCRVQLATDVVAEAMAFVAREIRAGIGGAK